jgi:UDP-2-acetamido-3-amino-2,3-dideoxy-glucuronate N-acetyltransferase
VVQIGCGHWGRNLARNFAELGALAGVVDFDPDTAARIAAQHGVCARTLDEVLADDAVDGVALATPAVTHAELALRSIKSGKHVFVEKPLAMEPSEALPVIRAADEHQRVLMVGHLLQYHPVFLKLMDMATNGELGQLRYVYSNRLSLGKFRVEENVLWSFAPHDISMILALAQERPEAVSAEGAAFVTPGIADWAVASMRFPSGLRAHVHASWSHPFKEHRLVAVGEDAMAVFEDSEPQWERRLALYRHKLDREAGVPQPIKAEAEYVQVSASEPLRAECQHFLDCIASGNRPRTHGREGLAVLDVLAQAETALAASLALAA